MNKFEKYSSYKDSGVEWLGEIPEHWKSISIKRLITLLTDYTANGSFADLAKNVQYLDEPSYAQLIRLTDIRKGFKEKGIYITEKSYKYLNKSSLFGGELLMANVGAYSGYSFLLPEKLDFKASLAPNMFLIKFNKKQIDNKFIFYALNSDTILSRLVLIATSTAQPKLNKDNVRSIFIPLPPQDEQTKIASFLDEKTAQIDEVISQKEKLIELLKERKQIVINDAVTKGLDKDVEFVDSGVEWIGKIPKGWEVKKLKFIIKNKLKYGANESGISYDEALPRYVRITDFSDTGKLSEKNKLSLSWDKGKDYLLKDGDVLFARSGATVGKTYQFKKSMSIEKNYAFAGYLIKAEANETMILSDYLYLYTNSNLFNRWKESIFNKATIENIGADKYSELFFTLPSIEEQKLILKNYFIKSTKIDKAIELQQNYISKLKEYKASLIDSVVTGKVKV